MMRVLIVDDEPLARDTARLVLEPVAEVVGTCTGTEAVAAIRALAPDVVVLDVQMPGVDGFGVIEQVGPAEMPAIVFVTAHNHYAVQAFEVHAVDYVLKPYEDKRLLAALARVQPKAYVQRFFVRGRERTLVVATTEVDFLEAADDYVELHVGETVHLVRARLAELEARLDPSRFVRIHRSAIVNLERVRELEPLERGDALVVLTNGATLRLARSRRTELERRLAGSP
jgi:two-component system LytT family response regulator